MILLQKKDVALPSPAYQITMSLFFVPNRVQILFGNKALRERKSLPQTQGMNPIGLTQARESPIFCSVWFIGLHVTWL